MNSVAAPPHIAAPHSCPKTRLFGHGLRAERILMGKIYFYAWDLALISATHVVLVGKIPAMKLDLAL